MDKITGSKSERKGLNEALAYVRPGDTFMVWKLDRAGRSLKHLMELLKDLQGRGIEFVSLTEQIDTTTPGGKLIFHLMEALAEFERDLIRERTNAGLAAARARGRVGGRPRKLKTKGKIALAKHMFDDQSHSIPEICAALGISRATLYRYVTTPHGLKPSGFSGSFRLLMAPSKPKSFDVYCSVVVSVQLAPTFARVPPL